MPFTVQGSTVWNGASSSPAVVTELATEDEFRNYRQRTFINSPKLSDTELVLPFGYTLFHRQNEIESNSAIQEQYILRRGDVISIWIWGAFEYQQQHKVDSQGQIFIEQLGPVKVAGVSVADLSGYLKTKLSKVYHRGVEIYANLQSVAPIPLLVSGYVNAPGQYLGSSGDGLLYYLSRARGIDIRQGSFRNIQIQRSGKVIASIDLYPFLKTGTLPDIPLKDFDVIFVPQSKIKVTAILPGKLPLTYELLRQPYTGGELLSLLNVPKYIVQVKLTTQSSSGTVEQTYSLEEFNTLTLKDGDNVRLSSKMQTSLSKAAEPVTPSTPLIAERNDG
ncbi:polysaccharide biosynthesis/export family protein [Thalassotalea sp. PS06]|uniref:polysaccharide biosynthesis/export family protein n=1 Tax=Thalassotalea sp. PS06 TaxID=2594005 RepID=UPI00163D9593|nr:polysaccharide biosynthesis/export family protein [Thalassotalea sp. PS06]